MEECECGRHGWVVGCALGDDQGGRKDVDRRAEVARAVAADDRVGGALGGACFDARAQGEVVHRVGVEHVDWFWLRWDEQRRRRVSQWQAKRQLKGIGHTLHVLVPLGPGLILADRDLFPAGREVQEEIGAAVFHRNDQYTKRHPGSVRVVAGANCDALGRVEAATGSGAAASAAR